MTDTYEVVVVGLGGIGGHVALRLAERGVSVLGLDAHRPPHTLGSSHGNSCVIREAYFEGLQYMPLIRRAYTLWDELEQRLGRRPLHPNGAGPLGAPRGAGPGRGAGGAAGAAGERDAAGGAGGGARIRRRAGALDRPRPPGLPAARPDDRPPGGARGLDRDRARGRRRARAGGRGGSAAAL